MQFKVNSGAISDITTDALVVFRFEDEEAPTLTELSQLSKNVFTPLLDKGVISSKVGQVTPLFGHSDLPATQVFIIGAGKRKALNENSFVKIIKSAASALKSAKASSATLAIDDIKPGQRTVQWCAEKATELMLTSLYQYDTTKSTKSENNVIEAVDYLAKEQNLDLAIKTGKSLAHGMNVARELGNLPANICTPAYLAEQATNLADAYDEISVEILENTEMEKLGMGALLAVAQGSANSPRLIVIKYQGGRDDQKPHVLVGKGLTFDTGGVSIKPALGMEDMKYDMLGAASVLGTISTLAELKPAINVVGVIAAAENMCSGTATRPGDVVTSMAGKTIEIINTDAEGRLVLCDALAYVARFEPASVIDIATLTGAVIIGLGHHPTAVYANNEALQQQLVSAGQACWDRGWPMPLWEDYREELDSPYADLRNIGQGRAAGSITAAMFLAEFTKDYNWAHLDIAGTGWTTAKEGATGRPVGMLTQYLLDRLS